MSAPRDTIILGDCIAGMASLDHASVDLVLTDLPYGTTRNKWDSVINLEDFWAAVWRVARPNAAVVLTAQAPFDKVLGVSQLQYLRYEWIWEKGNATGHLNAKKAPLKAHENILVFYRSQPTYNPQMTHGHERKTAVRRNAGKLNSTNYGLNSRDSHYDSTSRYPRSVQRFSLDKQKSKLHPTQKPIALFEYLIETYSNPGDLVLDACMGSGTTAVAAKNTGRHYLGFENDPAYHALALERVARASEEPGGVNI